jgi:uncharacterized protein (DUF934 family)
MRHILRQRKFVEDNWRYVGEDAAESAPLIVPFAQLKADLPKWQQRRAALGVRIGPADKVEELEALLPHLSLVAVEFPTVTDGRGYSLGRLLRTRLKFNGELRAVGVVKQDQVFLQARCGFDSFELAPGENVDEATRALQRYTVAYQPEDPRVEISRQRFHAGNG